MGACVHTSFFKGTNFECAFQGSDITLKFKSSQQVVPNRENVIEVPIFENVFHRPDGAPATRESLMMALADLNAVLIKLSYFSDSTSCSLMYVSMDYAQPEYNGNEMALAVSLIFFSNSEICIWNEDQQFRFRVFHLRKVVTFREVGHTTNSCNFTKVVIFMSLFVALFLMSRPIETN